MGKYLILIGICINSFHLIFSRFIWKTPGWLSITVSILGVSLILVGCVWGKPIKEALLLLAICVAIILIGAFLAWKFIK